MDLLNIGAIIVAGVAAFGAWAAQRAASKASTFNVRVSGRLEAEREAYERARAFDVATIKRQDKELTNLRRHNLELAKEVSNLKMRIENLEHDKIPQLERELDVYRRQSYDQE